MNFFRGPFFSTAVAAVLLLSGNTAYSAAVPPSVSSQAPAVVTVTVYDRHDKPLLTESGFVLDSNGLVAVSCNSISVWYGSMLNTLVIRTHEGTGYNTEELLSGGCRNNVALISIKGAGLSATKLSASGQVRAGEKAFLLVGGRPAAVSKIKGLRNDGLIKLDIEVPASANGAPVFNTAGDVIGVAVSFVRNGKPTDFVVPAKSVAKEHERYNAMIKKLLGASVEKRADAPIETKKADRAAKTTATEHAAMPLKQALPKPAYTPRPETKGTETVGKPKAYIGPQDLDSRASTQYSLAKFYEREGKIDDAVEAHKKTVLMDPAFTESYLEIGRLCFRLGRYPEAAEAYRKAIVFRRAEASTYTKLASAYLMSGNYGMAVDALKHAARIESSNPDIRFNLGVVFLVTGDKNGAIAEYTELKKINIEKAYELLDLIY
ncbi:MAG: serine protease [Nitrospirae bacterium]|nr:MAG: serine protease [Nitrospirota bacterium]